jgi:hypothetical protein
VLNVASFVSDNEKSICYYVSEAKSFLSVNSNAIGPKVSSQSENLAP